MYRAPPKRTPRVAAVLSEGRKNALVVLDPWELRVAMVAPIATIRLALLRERPVAVAANRLWPWLRHQEVDLVPVARTDLAAARAELPELRRFAQSAHERLIAKALALAEDALTHALHAQLASQNRFRPAPRAPSADAPARAPRRLPVPHLR